MKLNNLKMVRQVFYDEETSKVGTLSFFDVCALCAWSASLRSVARGKFWTLGSSNWVSLFVNRHKMIVDALKVRKTTIEKQKLQDGLKHIASYTSKISAVGTIICDENSKALFSLSIYLLLLSVVAPAYR